MVSHVAIEGTLWWGLCGRMGSNLVVSNVSLNQQLKVIALEARAEWDITINIWPLAQWYMGLWVLAWNACDLYLCSSLCKAHWLGHVIHAPSTTTFFLQYRLKVGPKGRNWMKRFLFQLRWIFKVPCSTETDSPWIGWLKRWSCSSVSNGCIFQSYFYQDK